MIYGFSSGIEYKFGKNGTASIVSIGSCTDKHIIIPEFFEGKTVTAVEDGAFSRAEGIVSITLPHTVSHIGKKAFAWSRRLEFVRASGVLEIGEKAFMGCEALTDITLGSKIKRIGKKAFAYCIELSSAELPSGISEIGASAFEGCRALGRVTLPESLRIIESGMFYACTSLSRVTLSNTVRYIDENAFAYCISLNDISIPRTAVINQNAFFECNRKAS
ncbi:MAG: leucine-rich repeat protein [Clostridia bacterium]|nr:leucine-rich repeat protein [Clostridia bacterium]